MFQELSDEKSGSGVYIELLFKALGAISSSNKHPFWLFAKGSTNSTYTLTHLRVPLLVSATFHNILSRPYLLCPGRNFVAEVLGLGRPDRPLGRFCNSRFLFNFLPARPVGNKQRPVVLLRMYPVLQGLRVELAFLTRLFLFTRRVYVMTSLCNLWVFLTWVDIWVCSISNKYHLDRCTRKKTRWRVVRWGAAYFSESPFFVVLRATKFGSVKVFYDWGRRTRRTFSYRKVLLHRPYRSYLPVSPFRSYQLPFRIHRRIYRRR